MAASRDDHVLLPCERDLDGLIAAERRDRRGRFEKRIAFLSEAAAERRCHNADVLLVHGEVFCEHPAHLKGRLRTGVHRDFAVLCIADGAHRLHAHVVLRLNVLGKTHLYDLGIGFAGIHVAGFAAGADNVAVRVHPLGDRVNAGELGIIDRYELCRGTGVLRRVGHDHGDKITEEAHLVRAEYRLIGRPCPDLVQTGNVFMRNDPNNARRILRRGAVHGVDARVRHGSKDKRAVEHRFLAELVSFVIVAVFERSGGFGKAVHIPDALSDEAPLDLGDNLSLAGYDLGRVVHLHGRKRHILAAQTRRGELHALDDLHIAGAAAVVLLQAVVYILFRRVHGFAQQRLCCHDHTRRAEAALHRARVEERALNDLQHRVVRKVFDCLHALSGERFEQRDARARELAVNEHAARAAVPGGASFLAPLHAFHIAQILQKGHAPPAVRRNRSAV